MGDVGKEMLAGAPFLIAPSSPRAQGTSGQACKGLLTPSLCHEAVSTGVASCQGSLPRGQRHPHTPGSGETNVLRSDH